MFNLVVIKPLDSQRQQRFDSALEVLLESLLKHEEDSDEEPGRPIEYPEAVSA
jgi:hypothetical protein